MKNYSHIAISNRPTHRTSVRSGVCVLTERKNLKEFIQSRRTYRPDQLVDERRLKNSLTSTLSLKPVLRRLLLVSCIKKQRQAVKIVKTALLRLGIDGRSVCVTTDEEINCNGERRENYAIFVQSGAGQEPFYIQGGTLVEAVKNMLEFIKIETNSANSNDQFEIAPF
jgi:hypothetical protein